MIESSSEEARFSDAGLKPDSDSDKIVSATTRGQRLTDDRVDKGHRRHSGEDSAEQGDDFVRSQSECVTEKTMENIMT